MTHRCVKGEKPYCFRPIWLDEGKTILDHVTEMLAEQLRNTVQQQEVHSEFAKSDSDNDEEDSFDIEMAAFGPDLMHSNDPGADHSDILLNNPINQTRMARDMLDAYSNLDKKYVVNRGANNKKHNRELVQKYNDDPRKSFWLNSALTSQLKPELKDFANFIYSVISASASPERAFSIMKHIISSRRSSITGPNTDMRLTSQSLLPAKRKLEDLMESRKIKAAKLFHHRPL